MNRLQARPVQLLAAHLHLQARLLALVTNPSMLRVNQAWAGHAGDRIDARAGGQEVWGKPLDRGAVAVVLFNRNGTVSTCNAKAPIDAPCDDGEVSGAQAISLPFALLQQQGWLQAAASKCEVEDVYGGALNAGSSRSLGVFTTEFVAQVPPHGAAFLVVSNCS